MVPRNARLGTIWNPAKPDWDQKSGFRQTSLLSRSAKRNLRVFLTVRSLGEHPDLPIFDSFPGVGKALAPRLLAGFGSLRRVYRFLWPNVLQRRAPVWKRSPPRVRTTLEGRDSTPPLLPSS